MEFAKAKFSKDRFIKGSISTLPEQFSTKWEIKQDWEWEEFHESMEVCRTRNKICDCANHASQEDDENQIYRAMLQSEMFNMGSNSSVTSDIGFSSDVQSYSNNRYSEIYK